MKLEPDLEAAIWLGRYGSEVSSSSQANRDFLAHEVHLLVMQQLRRIIAEDDDLKWVVCATTLTINGRVPMHTQTIGATAQEVQGSLKVYFCDNSYKDYTTG